MSKTLKTGNKNPYLPLNIYVPDGEPKIFDDRLYVYGSMDEFGGEYCSHKYHVFSAPLSDLTEWTDHGPAIASSNEYEAEGIQASVPWSTSLLYAPDIVKKGEKYYLYFCLADQTEGVAESLYPYGPFENARIITMGGKPIWGIDPSVYEENGIFYYTWGQGHAHLAVLNEDMASLDESTYIEAVVSHDEGQTGFHEGSSFRKIGDWYCMVYASEFRDEWPNNGGTPCKLDYAVSKNLQGPYTRRGTIIDNTGIDPATWNNHGSIIKIGDQWYVFYHGSSNNSKYARRARVERIQVDEKNGWISQAEMTCSGFAETLDPREELQAAYGYYVGGGAFFTEEGEEHPLTAIRDGASVKYHYFDFGDQAEEWKLVLQLKAEKEGRVTILVNGRQLGEIPMQSGKVSVELGPLTGKAELTVFFSADHREEMGKLYRILFEKKRS